MSWGEAVALLSTRFKAGGIDQARLDARLLVAEALGVGVTSLFAYPERKMTAGQEALLDALAARRLAREPVSRILGRREFWSLPFALSPATLDPRPDSETLVEAVLSSRPDRTLPLRLLDFGTGSGCILLALLSEYPNAVGTGIDRSPAALDTARANAAFLGLAGRSQFVEGDWGKGMDGLFDVIVSNPPYIPEDEIDRLEPEVCRFDPRSALAGGPDGLDCYRALAPDIARLLAPGGLVGLEVGVGQDRAVAALLEGAGLGLAGMRADLAGIPRCVLAERPF